MRALLRLLALRHLRDQPVRTLLAMLCITLGVGLYVSLEAAHETATHSFLGARDALVGSARWRVSRGRGLGVDLAALERVEAHPGAQAAPVIDLPLALLHPPREGPFRVRVRGMDGAREARLRGLESDTLGLSPEDLLALGVADLLAGSTSAVINAPLAKGLDLERGEVFDLRTPTGPRRVRVASVLPPTGADELAGALALVPLASLQDWLGRPDEADHIDVALAEDDVEELRAHLGPAYRVDAIEEAGVKIFEDMIANMRTLVLLSAIGLLAGLFIVYQVISVAVVERTRAIGTARALGATRRQVTGAFVFEAGVLGLVGSALGVLAGRAMAWSSLEMVGGLANLYVHAVEMQRVVLPARVVATGFGLGLATSLLAAFLPARRAARVPPAVALRPDQRGASLQGYGVFSTSLGAVLVALAVAGSLFPPRPDSYLLTGYAPALLLFLGVAMVLPRLLGALAWCLRPLLARGAVGRVALDGALRAPGRAALTSVALAGSLGLYVTAATQTHSAHVATESWVRSAYPYDLCVAPARRGGLYGPHTLEPEVAQALRSLPGVTHGYGTRIRIQEFGTTDVLVNAVDLADYRTLLQSRDQELFGGLDPEREARLIAGEGVVVSRNFALLHGVAVDEDLELRTPEGVVRLPILHLLDDFSWPKGVVLLDRERYRRDWRDERLSQFNVNLAAGVDELETIVAVHQILEGRSEVSVITGEGVRQVASWAVREAYGIVQAQVIVALLVGFLGTLSTISISVLQRRRELGLLRVVGMTRTQMSHAITLEALLMTTLGAAVGLAAGVFCAAFPASRLLSLVAGYVLPLELPVADLALVLFASGAIGVLASWLPARRAGRASVLEAVAYE